MSWINIGTVSACSICVACMYVCDSMSSTVGQCVCSETVSVWTCMDSMECCVSVMIVCTSKYVLLCCVWMYVCMCLCMRAPLHSVFWNAEPCGWGLGGRGDCRHEQLATQWAALGTDWRVWRALMISVLISLFRSLPQFITGHRQHLYSSTLNRQSTKFIIGWCFCEHAEWRCGVELRDWINEGSGSKTINAMFSPFKLVFL